MSAFIPDSPHLQTEYKPFKLVPYRVESNWLGKHVKWLQQERAGWSRIGALALATFEVALLTSTGIGLIVFYKGLRESKRLDAESRFFQEKQAARPPSNDPIALKTKTRTFNHIHDFAIEDETIWARPRNSQEAWSPLYFDGRNPVEMHCDGANLIVLDDQRNVHYKKVLREYRSEEVRESEKLQKKLGRDIDLEEDRYIAVDKATRNNWKDKWFSLPYLHILINLFTGKRLSLPENIKAWAISQRGKYNNYLEDALEHQHPVDVGVTTLYTLAENDKEITKYDPWSPQYVKIKIPLPEYPFTSFEAVNMSASASTLMIIGYEIKKQGEGVKKTLSIQTRLADIDSEGWNPGLKYDYFEHPQDGDVRVVPMPRWQDHPLELRGKAAVTKNITILQTGEGNKAREIRVEGIDEDGNLGYYFKNIDEQEWQFQIDPTSHSLELEGGELLAPTQDSPEAFETSVYNYTSQTAHLNRASHARVSASLYSFGQRSYESILKVEIEGEEPFYLHLQKRKTLKNFLGFSGDSYDLLLPEKLQQNERIKRLFNGKRVLSVGIKEEGENVHLSLPHVGHFSFKRTE